MTLQQLEYIVAVDKFRHFAKAAKYCKVTQPTLSAMVQKLEDELNVKIFDRDRQPISTTSTGKEIIKHAHKILSQADDIRRTILEEKHSVKGVFKLGILPTISPYLIPRFLPHFTEKYPQLDIKVIEMKVADIRDALQTHEIDAGIVADLEGMEKYCRETLYYERFFAYVANGSLLSKKNVIKTSDLSDSNLLLLDEGHCLHDQLRRFCNLKAAEKSRHIYHLGGLETFMRMVESGSGITFIPELATLQFDEKQMQLIRPFAIPVPTRQIVIITNHDFIRSTLLSAIINIIRASVPKEMHVPKPTDTLV